MSSMMSIGGRTVSNSQTPMEPGGGGAEKMFDFTKSDEYPRPYKTQYINDGDGAVRQVDLMQRRAFGTRRSVGRAAALFDPMVVFEEEYIRQFESGVEPDTAAQKALAAAEQEHQRTENMSPKAAIRSYLSLQKLYQKLQARQEKVSSMNSASPVLPNVNQLPIGASGHAPRRVPQGMRVTNTGVAPNARNPEVSGQGQFVDPRTAQIEMMTFRSVDGNTYSFRRKINGQTVPGLANTVAINALVEYAKGGDPRTVLAAARMKFADETGQVVFDFNDFDVSVADESSDPDQPAGMEFE